MKTHKKGLEPTSRALLYCAALAFIYILCLFVLPANSMTMKEYHLSSLEYRVVAFAVGVPSLLTWFAAFVGYAKLREYAALIRKTPEGIYYDRLAEGCMWLAWSLPVSSIVPLTLNALADGHPDLHAASIIISNYVALLLPLVGFSIIANASQSLLTNMKIKLSLANARSIIVAFLLLGVLYCFLVFRHLNLGSLWAADNAYYLPALLIVLTIIVPYLYAWFMGLLGTYEITLYRTHMRGVLYRQALGLMVGGLVTVILSSMALQYIGSIAPRIGHLVFDDRLVFITVFRIIGGAGFVLLAVGASKLKKIEEV